MDLDIRLEDKNDYRAVEELTREAFWNVHVPGCSEHHILHVLRESVDFIPGLDFVAVSEGRIVGNIVYSKSRIADGAGANHPVITFGPVSVSPSLQRQGVGSTLIRHSLEAAGEMGYPAVCIFGDPRYYSRFGFRCAEKYDVKTSSGQYAVALLALELSGGSLAGIGGRFFESPAFEEGQQVPEDYEKTFPHKEKLAAPTQEAFKLLAGLMW